MHKKVVQATILFGMLSIPTFASADGGLLGSTLNKSSGLVETVRDGVEDTVSEVLEPKSLAEATENLAQPVKEVADTVQETTKQVTEAVKSETPLVDVDASENPSIKINVGVVEAEVSKVPKVKVDTPIVKVEIDDSVKVDIERIKVETQVQKEEQPQIMVQTPVVNVETPKPEHTPHNNMPQLPEAETNLEQDEKQIPEDVEADVTEKVVPLENKPSQQDQPVIEDKTESVESQTKLPLVDPVPESVKTPFSSGKEGKGNKYAGTLPKMPVSEYEQWKVIPTFQSGPSSTPTKTAGTGGAVPFATLSGTEIAIESVATIYPTMTRLYYDQWLNAPPSQPPRQSLFTISSI